MTTTLAEIEDALARFHHDRIIFEDISVRLDRFLLPRQHSMIHYPYLIQLYGAPNGLCSSITESKHIKAVKEPYRRSNRFEALGQMLLTNQHLNKLGVAHADFTSRRMLEGSWAGLGLDNEVLLDNHPVVVDRLDEDDCSLVDNDLMGKVTLAKHKGRLVCRCSSSLC